MQQALEDLLAELLLGGPPTLDSLASACRRRGIEQADAEALAESFERLLVYRELVRGNLRRAVQLSIPRTMARLGAVFDEYFDRFLLERAPRTHYLRDVTGELLDYCAPLWLEDTRVPRFLCELAYHEALHIEVSALPTLARDHVAAPLSLEAGVALSDAVRLVSYRYAVHDLPASEDDRTEAAERPVLLLVYRSPEHEVRYLELTPLAYGIARSLLEGQALGRAVARAAEEAGTPLTEAVLSGAAQLLADLAQRGVVRGPEKGAACRPAG